MDSDTYNAFGLYVGLLYVNFTTNTTSHIIVPYLYADTISYTRILTRFQFITLRKY